MPSPREIALTKNSGLNGFDAEPPDRPAIDPQHKEPDYRANPKNPPAGPAPAKNLKGG